MMGDYYTVLRYAYIIGVRVGTVLCGGCVVKGIGELSFVTWQQLSDSRQKKIMRGE